MFLENTRIELYLGAPIEHASERSALHQVVASLRAVDRAAIIVANVHVSGRQVDLIVATDDLVLVVEAKQSARALRGGKNGHWEFLAATGEWTPVGRNYYRQTLEAKHAVHQAMCDFGSEPADYPDAALVFVGGIPEGSDIACDDYKVIIGDLALLTSFGACRKSRGWSFEQWRGFCAKHRLIAVQSLPAAMDARLAALQGVLADYEAAFLHSYGASQAGVVPFSCRCADGEVISSAELARRSVSMAGLLITGPTGCGKSLLMSQIGLQQAAHGRIPVLIEAKYFEGRLQVLLNQESTLLDVPSIDRLLAACRAHGKALIIILDAFNECPAALQKRLGRCLRAMAVRYQVGLIIASQEPCPALRELKLPMVGVLAPDMVLKRAIAKAHGSVLKAARIEELLTAVHSGLEASIIGQVGSTLAPGASRYALFDAYLRQRLGSDSSGAIALLTGVAGWLSDHVCSSMTVRDLDRLAQSEQGSSSHLQRLLAAGLLHRRGDRLSFGHELYQAACSAEAVIRRSHREAENVLRAIAAPRHAQHRALMVGAIDEPSLLHAVLEGLVDVEVIVSCLQGECGEYARQWADERCGAVLGAMHAECRCVRVSGDENAWTDIVVEAASLRPWTVQERAFLAALPRLLVSGRCLEEIFDVITAMQERVDELFAQLSEKSRKRTRALRSSLFAAAFDDQNSEMALSRIIARLHLHFDTSPPAEATDAAIDQWVLCKLADPGIADGRLMMILRLCRSTDRRAFPVRLLPQLIRDRWRSAPNQLLIELLQTAQYAWAASDEEKSQIVEAIHEVDVSNMLISMAIMDALDGLGAIEDDGYHEVAKREVAEVLANREDPEQWAMAQSLYTRQFDHPHNGIYFEVIRGLPDEQRKDFLKCAVRAKDDFRMFVSCIISDLARFKDKAAGESIEHWTELPPADCSMVQDAIEVFVVSHMALGLLQYPLAAKIYRASNEDNALMACGEVLYWSNRKDLSPEDRATRCAQAWVVLMRHEHGVSLSTIRECERASSNGVGRLMRTEGAEDSLIRCFPEAVAEIGRRAIAERIPQLGLRSWMQPEEILRFAFDVIGASGRITDLPLLRGWVDHPELGAAAFEAVRRLEQRLVSP